MLMSRGALSSSKRPVASHEGLAVPGVFQGIQKLSFYVWLPHVTVCIPSLTYTTTTIVLWPFVRDYPGEPVPEETLTHPPS